MMPSIANDNDVMVYEMFHNVMNSLYDSNQIKPGNQFPLPESVILLAGIPRK